MPGTTEPDHLFSGVYVACDGVFWHVASNNSNTVVSVATDSIDVQIEDDDSSIFVEAGS